MDRLGSGSGAWEQTYEAYMEEQRKSASGERRRRLREGQGHAERRFVENVWWPAVGSWDYLQAEYQVQDFRDGTRFLDYAYLRPPYKICIEIDGYGPHQRDTTRWQFADGLYRQNQLVLDDWKVLRFAYDDIMEKPRRCQQLIQQFLGRWYGEEVFPAALSLREKDILRFVLREQRAITPAEAAGHLGISTRYARELLQQLVEQRLLLPASGSQRVRAYKLNPQGKPAVW
ncbi:hypothetical protein [Paenibacillus mucilaginosus]|uniref:hypothetical protein n=1 Tax=Paenibacillus mucilaginosus TaxID=61624 RepID=UPI00059F5604|nr:hypothetical protein [Paenibacillus mucilaginosus]MCG7215044.1 DNA-binding response regulator [Paenibacillus mucilaginosus]WDM27147.1 DNA-binding response regulator [Paenibacillus mucilaginosus]